VTWDGHERKRAFLRAVEEVCGEMDALRARFEAAPSDAEKWPIALRMLRLGPRLYAIRDRLERLN
jgi:hypothetical protein